VAALKKQAESGLEAGADEEKSAFLTYLLSETDLSTTEVVSNCIDLMLAAVDTVGPLLSCSFLPVVLIFVIYLKIGGKGRKPLVCR